MKVLIDIPEESIRYANEIPNTYCKWLLSHNDIVRAIKLGTPIPDNATNGDVVLVIFKEIQHYSDGKICADWWNAPYKRGNE